MTVVVECSDQNSYGAAVQSVTFAPALLVCPSRLLGLVRRRDKCLRRRNKRLACLEITGLVLREQRERRGFGLDGVVQPLQARGAFGPRDFDKYVFYVPIPLFDARDPLHVQIAELGAQAEELAAAADVPESLGFQRARAVVRAFLEHEGVAAAIEATVSALIPTP
jgi:hypothetical protein